MFARIASVATVVLLASTTAAAGRAARICWADAVDMDVTALLRDALAASGLDLIGTCRPGHEAFGVQIVDRDGAVYVVLATPSGRELDRRLPWLDKATAALAETARLRRMPHLAVLVAGLIAEQRVSAAARPDRPHWLHGPHRQGSVALPRRLSETVGPINGAVHESVAAQESKIAAWAQQRRGRAEVMVDDAEPYPVAKPDSKTAGAGPRGDAPPRRPVPLPVLQSAGTRPVRPDGARRWPWELELFGSSWLHSAASSSRLGIGGRLAWGPITAKLNYQPAVTASLTEMEMVGGAVGVRYDLFRAHWLVVDLGMALDVERQTATFPEQPDPSPAPEQRDPHRPTGSPAPPPPSSAGPAVSSDSLWLFGPVGSLHLAVPVALGLHAGVGIDFRWLFSTKQAPDNLPWNRGWDLGVGFFLGYAI